MSWGTNVNNTWCLVRPPALTWHLWHLTHWTPWSPMVSTTPSSESSTWDPVLSQHLPALVTAVETLTSYCTRGNLSTTNHFRTTSYVNRPQELCVEAKKSYVHVHLERWNDWYLSSGQWISLVLVAISQSSEYSNKSNLSRMLEWQNIDIILAILEWPGKHDQRNKISQWKRIPQIPAAMRTSRRQHSPLPSLSCYGFTGTHLMNLKSHKNASVNKTSTEQDWVRNNLSTWSGLKATKPILMFKKIFGFIKDIFLWRQ